MEKWIGTWICSIFLSNFSIFNDFSKWSVFAFKPFMADSGYPKIGFWVVPILPVFYSSILALFYDFFFDIFNTFHPTTPLQSSSFCRIFFRKIKIQEQSSIFKSCNLMIWNKIILTYLDQGLDMFSPGWKWATILNNFYNMYVIKNPKKCECIFFSDRPWQKS